MADVIRGLRTSGGRPMVPFDTPNETTAENEARFRAQVQSELQRQQREIEDLRLGLAAVVRRLDEGGVP